MQTAEQPVVPNGNGAKAAGETFAQRSRREREAAMRSFGKPRQDDNGTSAPPPPEDGEHESGKSFELNEETISTLPPEQQALARIALDAKRDGTSLKEQFSNLMKLLGDSEEPTPNGKKKPDTQEDIDFEFPEIAGFEGIRDPLTMFGKAILEDNQKTRQMVQAIVKRLDESGRSSERERFETANPDWQKYEPQLMAKGRALGGLPKTAKGMTELLNDVKNAEKLKAKESAEKARGAKGGSNPRFTSSTSVRQALANHTGGQSAGGLRGAWEKAKQDAGVDW